MFWNRRGSFFAQYNRKGWHSLSIQVVCRKNYPKTSHCLLAEVFSKGTGGQPLPPLGNLPQGKPFFNLSPSQLAELGAYAHFNLSHSGDFTALAFGAGELGLDIQVPREPGTALIQRVCSAKEQQWLAQHPGEFALLWAMKEAYVKYTGQGVGSGKGLCQLELPLPCQQDSPLGLGEGQVSWKPLRFHWWRQPEYSLVLCHSQGNDPCVTIS